MSIVEIATGNDLMLLNFGNDAGLDNNPSVLRPLASGNGGGVVHNCYKFALAPNGRMLANVLGSGEVLLHNLDSYRRIDAAALAMGHHRKAARNIERPGSGTSSCTGSLGRRQRSPRKAKLEQQINALQVQVSTFWGGSPCKASVLADIWNLFCI